MPFGWTIVFEFSNEGNLQDVYPARVKFRGFSDDVMQKSYRSLSQYMFENGEELFNEVE